MKFRIGESFIEVIVAMMIVVISISIALNLLLSTTDSTAINRNFLIAEGLVDEGLEAMTNIIYTNVLKFGVENVDECWLVFSTNNIDGEFFANECDQNKIISIPDNILTYESILERDYENADLHWELSRRINQALDLENDSENAELFRLYLANFNGFDGQYYTNESLNNSPSKYYRSVKMTINPVLQDEVDLTAKVQWRSANTIREIEKTITISNANFVE